MPTPALIFSFRPHFDIFKFIFSRLLAIERPGGRTKFNDVNRFKDERQIKKGR